MKYDLVIIGAGPGGIFSCYEASRLDPSLKIAVLEAGNPLEKRKCPIDGVRIKSCINCPSCAIMNGFGGAGAFSDGKYNITNEFGGNLYEYVGRAKAIELMEYVDDTAANRPVCFPTTMPRSAKNVSKTTCICSMPRSAISVRTSTMSYWKTYTTSSRKKPISSSTLISIPSNSVKEAIV